MSAPQKFLVLLRRPRYPVIVLSADRLRAAENLQQLADACVISTPPAGSNHINVVDITLEIFWYDPDTLTLMPGFMQRIKSKKALIDIYNQSANARESERYYSEKSLANKSVARVVMDLIELMRGTGG